MQVRTVRQDALFIEKQGRHSCGGLAFTAEWQDVPKGKLDKGFRGSGEMTLRERLQSDPMLECSEGEPKRRGPGRPPKAKAPETLPLDT